MRPPPLFQNHRGFSSFFRQIDLQDLYITLGSGLNEAYNQLLQYSGDLGNPPLLIVSDMERIDIRTRFTDYPTTTHTITLDTFAWPANLERLRCAFYEPKRLRPEKTIEKITEEAAKKLAELSRSQKVL